MGKLARFGLDFILLHLTPPLCTGICLSLLICSPTRDAPLVDITNKAAQCSVRWTSV